MPQFHQSSVVIERERGNENLGMSNCLPDESRNPQDGNDVNQFAHYRLPQSQMTTSSREALIVLLTATREAQRYLAFASLQLMTSLAVGRTVANVNPPVAAPQITGADT